MILGDRVRPSPHSTRRRVSSAVLMALVGLTVATPGAAQSTELGSVAATTEVPAEPVPAQAPPPAVDAAQPSIETTPTTAASAALTTTSTGPATTGDPASSSTSSPTSVSTSVPDPAPDGAGRDATEGSGADTDAAGDGSGGDPDAADPLSQEGPGEEAPGVDPDLPPPDTYGGQEPYAPPEILWSSVAEAERKLERAEQDRRDAIAAVRALRLRRKHLDLEQQALDLVTAEAVDELGDALDRYRDRAVADFRLFGAGLNPLESGLPADAGSASPGLGPADTVLDPTDLRAVIERQRGAHLASVALGVGSRDLSELGKLRQRLDGEAGTLLDRIRLVIDYQEQATAVVAEAKAEIEQARIEYEAFKAGSEVFISGVVFPIGGLHDLPLIDSYGFPRMVGTADEHWHEGIDLFAPRGTPLVATERGLITRIGSGRLGGLKLWLVGESGTEWYYAHLDSFADALTNGQIVEAGDLLGYVGNTGNAIGTPPHLHLQMHPDGGRPVNPYPLLKTVSDLDQEAIATGAHPGYEHLPVVVRRSPAATTDPAPASD